MFNQIQMHKERNESVRLTVTLRIPNKRENVDKQLNFISRFLYLTVFRGYFATQGMFKESACWHGMAWCIPCIKRRGYLTRSYSVKTQRQRTFIR